MGPSGIDGGPVPVRATYFNLYKWPESDAEFIKSVIFHNLRNGGDGRSGLLYGEPRAVGGFSCRQLFLRSYTFSRKKDYTAMKSIGRVKQKIKTRCLGGGGGRKIGGSIFRQLLSCTIKIDVID